MVTAAEVKSNAAAIMTWYYTNKAAMNAEATSVPVDPAFDKDPPKHIRGYKQTSADVSGDSTLTARDIGNLTQGKTRLNVISALTKNDNVDFFKFTATSNEKLGIAITTDKGVHVQILNSKGRVIADSEAKYGDKYDNFQKAGSQNLDITKGTYYLKVTRDTGTLNTVNPNYAIQVTTTKYYENDYDTTETPAVKTTYASAATYAGSGMNDLLTQMNGSMFDFGNGSYYSKKV